jgi:hypothetical protein
LKHSVRLEIVVTFQRKRFKAVSPSFPNCQGIGKSEDEAVDKLGTAISKRIADVAKQTLSQIVTSDFLSSEPIETTEKTKVKGTRRVYELDAGAFGRPAPSRLSYPAPSPDVYKVPPEQDIRRLIGALDHELPERHHSFPMAGGDDDFGLDGMVFGFPLNLN